MGVDILDGTPLVDIKPYAPQFDCFEVSRVGWLQNKGSQSVPADNRFARKGEARREGKTGVS
jgi:tRNA (Thr-GGU) A37 N-methylase